MASKRSPVELASDIGSKAHDLYQHGDLAACAALRIIAKVNPEILAWLRDRLLDITQQPDLPQSNYARRLLVKPVVGSDPHDFVGGFDIDPTNPAQCQICGKEHK